MLLAQNRGAVASAGGAYSGGGIPELKLPDIVIPGIPEAGTYREKENIYQANIPTELPVVPYTGGQAWAPGVGAPAGMTLPTYEAQAAAIREANPGMTATESFRQVRILGSTSQAVLSAAPAFESAGPAGSVARIAAMRAAGLID